jgi:hypothetical protein
MSMETKHPRPTDSHGEPGSGYERRDVNVRALLKLGFWMAVLIAATLVAMRWTFSYFERVEPLGPPASPFATTRELPPSPRLQAKPRFELKDYCEVQQREVETYGWIDRRLGVVRIPIDHAMDLVLERGLPTRSSQRAPAGAAAVTREPASVPGGADSEGQCGYLAPQASEAREK